MATPKKGYHNAAGVRVPSVTTILGRYKASDGLMWWAWDCGVKGLDYRDVRDAAATAGTLAHSMVEAWVHNQDFVPDAGLDDAVVEKARTAFGAFLEWARQTQLEITHTEVGMVSETLQVGGTLDAMVVNGKRSLADWKSSNALYPDNLMQIAAYGALWNEHNPDDPITGGYHLVRFSKEEGDFEHRWFGDLSEAAECFKLLRAAYEIDKKLQKRVR